MDSQRTSFGNAGGTIMTNGKDGISPQIISAMKRRAQVGGNVSRMAQAPFNPFIQNLDIPQDYYLRNTYKRHFAKTNPIVSNACALHSEFPLSDFHLTHDDDAVEEFLNDMLKETNFYYMMLLAAQEFWVIGEFNMFSFFDDPENPSCYTGFALLDPNKLVIASDNFVQGHQKEVVQLQFDSIFKKIIEDGPNHPVTGLLYQHLPSDMMAYCKAGRPMPLSSLQVSRVKRGNYFNIRGDSIIETVFPLCFHPDHECMTRDGFKHYAHLTLEDEIATVNVESGELEYQKPEAIHEFDFEGNLIDYKKAEVCVTPAHRMLVQAANWIKKSNNLHEGRFTRPWEFIEAGELAQAPVDYCGNFPYRFRGTCDEWKGTLKSTKVWIGEFEVPIEIFLPLAGYMVSEGSVGEYVQKDKRRPDYMLPTFTVAQKFTSKNIEHFDQVCANFDYFIPLCRGMGKDGMISYRSNRRCVHEYFKEAFGTGCKVRKIPKWIKDLPRDYLWLFLDYALRGDGTTPNGRKYTYLTTSKELADDIQEIAFKLGYAPRVTVSKKGRKCIYPDGTHGITKSDKYHVGFTRKETRAKLKAEDMYDYPVVKKPLETPYAGKVWCVTVPNGTVVTRRNWKLSVQGNCMLKDQLRTVQRAISQRCINPLEIWKIGETGEPADSAEILEFQNIVQQTWYDAPACFHPSHECMTRAGFKHYKDLTLEDEIATINVTTGALEYQKQLALHEYDFNGDLVHFTKGYNDIIVTPNHRMLVQRQRITHKFKQVSKKTGKAYTQHVSEFENAWNFVEAKDIRPRTRFRGVPDDWEGESPDNIMVGDVAIPTDIYCAFAGYFVSEGSTDTSGVKNTETSWGDFVSRRTSVCQKIYSEHIDDFEEVCKAFSNYIPLWRYEWDELVTYTSGRKDIQDHFEGNYGHYAINKKVPEFVRNLTKKYLSIFLQKADFGDGHQHINKESKHYASCYGSISTTLIAHIQEICFKLGYPSHATLHTPKGTRVVFPDGKEGSVQNDQWMVYFSYPNRESDNCRHKNGVFPYVGDYDTWKKDYQPYQYSGKVWCVSTPNTTVITRRNGRISCQGQSIIWHHALSYECHGAEGRYPNFWPEFDGIDNEVCTGLMINKGLILGDSSTFASDVTHLDILINRYLMFRDQIEHWILNSIIAPILKIHEIYVPESKVKSMRYREMCGKGRPLAYPKIEWDKASLRDENAKVSLMTSLAEKHLIPESTLQRLLNINPVQARKKIEEETIAKLEWHQNLLKKIQAMGLQITPEVQQILGFEPSQGGPGESGGGPPPEMGGIPSSVEGGGGGSMPSEPEAGLPEVGGPNPAGGPPGGATAGIEKQPGVQGAPSESHMPTGIPTGR
jgi:hypothetical protein